jgi:hypothetical protein
MTTGKLKKLLNRLPNDIEIFIDMGEDMGLIQLCGKTVLEVIPFTEIENPELVNEKQVIIFQPCFCHEDEESDQEEEKVKLN